MAKVAIKIVKKGLQDMMTFGRYKGRTIEEMLDEDPDYLTWAHSHVDWFKLEPDILDQAIEAALANPKERPYHGGGENPYWWCDDYEAPF